MNQNHALEYIETWLKRRPRPRILIAVAGGTCSGKTFFSQKIREYFGLDQVSILRLDDFFKDFLDPSLPHDGSGAPIFDVPNSYLSDEYVQDIAKLLSGTAIWSPLYDISQNRRLSSYGEALEPKRIIVAEGLFTIQFLRHLNPLKIYIDTRDDIRCSRRVARDTFMLQVSPEVVTRVFYSRFLPLHHQFVAPQNADADLIVEGVNG